MVTKMDPGLFFGEKQGFYESSGFRFIESYYHTNTIIREHCHSASFFCYVIGGRYTQVYGHKQREGFPSLLTYHPAGEVHSNRWHAGGRCLHIEVPPAKLELVSGRAHFPDAPADFRGGLPVRLAARLYEEFRQADDLSPIAMEGIALEILAASARRPADARRSKPPRWLLRVREILEDRFSDNPSLSEIAAELDVSPDHLSRAFRRHFGRTIGEFVRGLRVDFARRLISATDRPLVEIALDAGFADQSHLTKTFKNHTGMTPARFRDVCRTRRSGTNG